VYIQGIGVFIACERGRFGVHPIAPVGVFFEVSLWVLKQSLRLKVLIAKRKIMFCSNCGSEILDKQHFCSSCGSAILEKSQVATVAPAINLTEIREKILNKLKQTKLSKRNKLMALVALLVLSVLGAVFFFLPKSVDVKFALKSMDDVTFTQDCKPTLAKDAQLTEAIQMAFISSRKLITEYIEVEGNWKDNTSSDGCLFEGSVKIPRNADSYNAKLISAAGTKLIADGLTLSGVSDVIELKADASQYQRITGILTLNVSVSLATMSDCLKNLVFITGGSCGSLSIPQMGMCNGTGGYSDIGSGTVIRVSTDNNTELGIGRLETGMGKRLVSEWWVLKGRQVEASCKFDWNVEVPKISGDYRFGIGDRGERSYSYESLQSSGWRVSLSLG